MSQSTTTVVDADKIAADSLENPAYGAHVIARIGVPLHEISVRLHGEAMSWERAVLEVLDMGVRMDDPEAIRDACNALREGFAAKVRTQMDTAAGFALERV